MADIYPEFRHDVATILRTLPPSQPAALFDLRQARRCAGADLLDYVESTESGDDALQVHIWELEAQIEAVEAERDANKDDLSEANAKYAQIRGLVSDWVEMIDEIDADSETREDLIPILKRMRDAIKAK